MDKHLFDIKKHIKQTRRNALFSFCYKVELNNDLEPLHVVNMINISSKLYCHK